MRRCGRLKVCTVWPVQSTPDPSCGEVVHFPFRLTMLLQLCAGECSALPGGTARVEYALMINEFGGLVVVWC
jgi:hypothetical protein